MNSKPCQRNLQIIIIKCCHPEDVTGPKKHCVRLVVGISRPLWQILNFYQFYNRCGHFEESLYVCVYSLNCDPDILISQQLQPKMSLRKKNLSGLVLTSLWASGPFCFGSFLLQYSHVTVTQGNHKWPRTLYSKHQSLWLERFVNSYLLLASDPIDLCI